MSAEPVVASVPESPWGPDDRIGAAHLLPGVFDDRLRGLIGSGRLFDLTMPISPEAPRISPGMSPFTMCLWSHPFSNQAYNEDVLGARNGMGYADERVEGDLHTGTHIDALGHVWVGDLGFNRRSMRAEVGNGGLRELGIENLPPVVTRGVLVDAVRHLGRFPDPGEAITDEHLASWTAADLLEIAPGDAVFIRTGWSRHYGDPERFAGPAPGIDTGAAAWLADRGATVVGSDNMSVEVWPSSDPAQHSPVHVELLVRRGVYLLEQADLEPLAAAGVREFVCFGLAPLYVGGTAAPVRLLGVA